MSRKIQLAVVAALSLLVLPSPARAFADDCVALAGSCATDPISPDPDETLDDPIGTVTDVVDDVTDPADPMVDPVLKTVDDLLGGGGIVEPPGGEGPGGHEIGPGTLVLGRGGSAPERGSSSGLGAAGPTALAREAVRPATIIGSAATGTRPGVPPHGAPGRFDGIIEGAVRGLLVLLILFSVTVGFLLIQGRLDRNDPKLARAPVRAEVVTFA